MSLISNTVLLCLHNMPHQAHSLRQQIYLMNTGARDGAAYIPPNDLISPEDWRSWINAHSDTELPVLENPLPITYYQMSRLWLLWTDPNRPQYLPTGELVAAFVSYYGNYARETYREKKQVSAFAGAVQ